MSDLYEIYDGIIYVANVRYQEKTDNVLRVILASVSDRSKVFCIENPPYIDEIEKTLQPMAGIPNGVNCWFSSAQMKHNQKLGQNECILPSVGVQNKYDFVYLTKVCNIRTVKIDEEYFNEAGEWSSNTEDEKKLEENNAYRVDPKMTLLTWRLARKIEMKRKTL